MSFNTGFIYKKKKQKKIRFRIDWLIGSKFAYTLLTVISLDFS